LNLALHIAGGKSSDICADGQSICVLEAVLTNTINNIGASSAEANNEDFIIGE